MPIRVASTLPSDDENTEQPELSCSVFSLLENSSAVFNKVKSTFTL